MRIAIIGGGIGGLTLASALKDAHEVLVVERAPQLDGVGAGLLLHEDALAALARCGVEVGGRAYDGVRLGLPDGRLSSLQGQPGRALSRPALHSALREAIGDVFVQLGTTVVALEERPDDVRVSLSNGQRLDVDLLVGADGLGSSIRELLGEPAQRVYSGTTCWRALSPVQPDLDGPVELWGPGRRAGIVPLEGATYVYLTLTAPPREERAPPVELFADFPAYVRETLAGVPSDAWLHHDLDALDRHAWGRGKVVLLGDAAHGFTPNLGEGAAQAILDADHLARCVLDDQLARWPGPRIATNARIARLSSWMGHLGQLDGWPATLRDTLLGMVSHRPAGAR